MKKLWFPYYISFGRGDNVDLDVEVSLNDEEISKLEASAKEGGRFHLSEDDDLADLYNKVYRKVKKELRIQLTEDPELVINSLELENCDKPIECVTAKQINKYIENLAIGINYPQKYQFLEAEEVEKVFKQSNCNEIILTLEEAQLRLKDKDFAKNNIVYVNEGEKLYWVPKAYSGTFTFKSKCRSVGYNVFKQRNKINEVLFEEGMAVLPDWLFVECKELTSVTFPQSMREIGFNSFFNCSKLSKIVFNEGLEKINESAFRGCSSLTELTIPASVKEINTWITFYPHMFYQLESFSDIYLNGKDTIITGKPEGWHKICMHVVKNSEAEKFAKENEIKYKIVG